MDVDFGLLAPHLGWLLAVAGLLAKIHTFSKTHAAEKSDAAVHEATQDTKIAAIEERLARGSGRFGKMEEVLAAMTKEMHEVQKTLARIEERLKRNGKD